MSVDGAADVGVHRSRLSAGRTHPRPDQPPKSQHGHALSRHPDSTTGGVTDSTAEPEPVPEPTGFDPARPVESSTVGADTQNARAEFRDFFENHHRELARFAYLLTGDRDVADDLTAEALTAAWSRWERVSTADSPLAYVRRIVANLATSRLRRVIRERRGMTLLGMLADHSERAPEGADVPAAMDLRAALIALPVRKRACVVLRYAFDLSEQETARTLGISVGTVKSQTSKAVAELERLLGSASGLRRPDRPRSDAARRDPSRPDTPQPSTPQPGTPQPGSAQPDAVQPEASLVAAAPRHSGPARSRRRSAGAGDPAGVARSALNRLRDGEARPRLRGSES